MAKTPTTTTTTTKPATSPPAACGLELREMRAGDLRRNPANWRRHPPRQLAAIRSVLDDPDVGWAGVILLNSQTNQIIDGHGRLETLGPDETVPVLVGS